MVGMPIANSNTLGCNENRFSIPEALNLILTYNDRYHRILGT